MDNTFEDLKSINLNKPVGSVKVTKSKTISEIIDVIKEAKDFDVRWILTETQIFPLLINLPKTSIPVHLENIANILGLKLKTLKDSYKIYGKNVISNLNPNSKTNILLQKKIITKIHETYFLNIKLLQEYIVEKKYIIYCSSDRGIYYYTGKYYKEIDKVFVNQLCQKILGKYRDLFKIKDPENIIHYLQGNDHVNEEKKFEDNKKYITFNNGLFDLEDMSLKPFNKDIFTTNILTYDYDKNAKCGRFKEFLLEIFEKDFDKIKFVQEIMGYCFCKWMPIHSIFLFIGSGRNGKSVLLDVLLYLIGDENTSKINLNDFTNKESLGELNNKMLNFATETDKRPIDTNNLKGASAGDVIKGRILYKGNFDFRSTAKLFFSMNEIPKLQDSSRGMWDRIFPVEFSKYFSEDERDSNLTSKLLKELPGIFNFAIDGLKCLQMNNFKLTVKGSLIDAKETYKMENDNELNFTSKYFIDSSKNILISTVYYHYEAFCKDEKIESLGRNKFNKSLRTMGYTVKKDTQQTNFLTVKNISIREDIKFS